MIQTFRDGTLEHNRKFMLESNLSELLFSNYSSFDEDGVVPTELEEVEASEQRHRLYKNIGIKVYVSDETRIELEGARFSNYENALGTPARTGRRP